MTSHERDWAGEARRRAHDENDPEMLIGADLIHYTELLIRFHDHRVLSEHYQFWGNLADYLNRVMHYPERTDASLRASEFSTAVAMCAGYLRMSTASQEVRLDLLRRYFPPPRQITADSPDDLGAEGERLARQERWT